MDKSLKGVLAHYGVEEVITRLKDILSIAVFDPTSEITTDIKKEIEQHSNDAELIASIMESYPVQNENGGPSVLNTTAEWEFPLDKSDFEAEAENLIIARKL